MFGRNEGNYFSREKNIMFNGPLISTVVVIIFLYLLPKIYFSDGSFLLYYHKDCF